MQAHLPIATIPPVTSGIEMHLGPMFSGKTTALLMRHSLQLISGRRCCFIKHVSDDERLTPPPSPTSGGGGHRPTTDASSSSEKEEEEEEDKTPVDPTTWYRKSTYYVHQGVVATASDGHHLGTREDDMVVYACLRLSAVEALVRDADCIFIDEAQWFPELDETVTRWAWQMGKRVYLAALNSDFGQRPFVSVARLTVWASHVKNHRAICMRCKREGASLSVRFRPRPDAPHSHADGKPIVLVGGIDRYAAWCGTCLMNPTNRAQIECVDNPLDSSGLLYINRRSGQAEVARLVI